MDLGTSHNPASIACTSMLNYNLAATSGPSSGVKKGPSGLACRPEYRRHAVRTASQQCEEKSALLGSYGQLNALWLHHDRQQRKLELRIGRFSYGACARTAGTPRARKAADAADAGASRRP